MSRGGYRGGQRGGYRAPPDAAAKKAAERYSKLPVNMPRESLVCRYHVLKSGCTTRHCTRGNHDDVLRRTLPQRVKPCRVTDTERGARIDMDFHCFICNLQLVTRENNYRLNKKCVWARAVTDNVIEDEETEMHPVKNVLCRRLFCRCGAFLGERFLGRAGGEGDDDLVEYKLQIFQQRKEDQIMTWVGEMPTEGQVIEGAWRSDKRNVERQYLEGAGVDATDANMAAITDGMHRFDFQTAQRNRQLEAELQAQRTAAAASAAAAPSCGICFEVYDAEEHAKYAFPCGHVLCAACQMPLHECHMCRKLGRAIRIYE